MTRGQGVSHLTGLVAELVRAANTFDGLGDFEKRRLLDRAYRSIEEGRREIGVHPSQTEYDAAIDFLTISRSPESFSLEEQRAALLDAAEMLRTMKILLDAKAEVERGE